MQFEKLTLQDRILVEKTLNQLSLNPKNNDYIRPYLSKYNLKQIHPKGNKQLTLFFETLENGDLFIKWLNDYNCLHNTRMSFGEDPCIKELEKFLSSTNNVLFSKEKHLLSKSFNPKYGNVIFLTSSSP